MNSLCEKANREKGCETIETSKGSVTSNNGQGKQEKEYNEQTAKFLAEKYGHDIVLLPRKNDEVSADAWNVTLKIKQEYKRLLTKSRNALDMALKKAAKQADNIVVNITIDYNDEMIIDVLSDRVRRKSSIKSVWLIKNNKSVRMTRDEILSFNANKKIEWE